MRWKVTYEHRGREHVAVVNAKNIDEAVDKGRMFLVAASLPGRRMKLKGAELDHKPPPPLSCRCLTLSGIRHPLKACPVHKGQ